MAKIQFSGNSINAYENLKHQYANGKLATSFTKGTGKSGGQLWEDYASNDMLDSLVSVYMNTDKLGSIDSFESKYSDYDYMDTNTRIAAASTELYADRETLNTYERYKTDEDGNYIQKDDGTYETEEYEDTEYNYYKSYLDSQAEYQKELYLATYKEKIEKEGNGFTQFFATFTISPFLNFVSSTLSAFLNIPQLLGATFNSKIGTADYGEEFRSIMAEEWNPLAEMVADFDAKYTWLTDEYGDYNTLGEITLGVANTLGMMMPSLAGQGIASGIATGATSLANAGYTTAANVLSNVAKVGSKVASMSYWVTMGVSTLQDYCRDENLQSVNVGALVAMAAATTTYEALVTKGMTAIFGGTQIDKMLFGSSTTGIASTLAGKITGEGGFKTAARTMIRIAIDGLKEGIEEVLQEAGTAAINNIASMFNEGFSTYGQFTGKQFGMAIGVSFLTTFITSGVSIVNNAVFGDSYTNNVVTDKNGNIVLNKDGTVKYKKMSWIDATDYKQAMSDLGTTMNKLSEIAKNKDLSAKDKLKITAAVDDITHMIEAIGEFYNANADDIANVLKIVDGLRNVSSSKGKTTEYYTSKTVTNDIKDVFTENDDKFGTVNTKKGELSAYDAVNNVVKIKNGYRVENADGTSTEYRRFKNGGYSVTHLPDYATIAQNILEELGILQIKGKRAGLEAVATKKKLADAQVTKATAIDQDNVKDSLRNAGIDQSDADEMANKIKDLIGSSDTDQVVITDGNSGQSFVGNNKLFVSKDDFINLTTQQILQDVEAKEVKEGLATLNKFKHSFNAMFKIYSKMYGENVTKEEFVNALLINDHDLIYKMFVELQANRDALTFKQLVGLSDIVQSMSYSVATIRQMARKTANEIQQNVQNALDRFVKIYNLDSVFEEFIDDVLTDEQRKTYRQSAHASELAVKVNIINSRQGIIDYTMDDVTFVRQRVNGDNFMELHSNEVSAINEHLNAIENYLKNKTDENLQKVKDTSSVMTNEVMNDLLEVKSTLFSENSLEGVLLNEFFYTFIDDVANNLKFLSNFRNAISSSTTEQRNNFINELKSTSVYNQMSDFILLLYNAISSDAELDSELKSFINYIKTEIGQFTATTRDVKQYIQQVVQVNNNQLSIDNDAMLDLTRAFLKYRFHLSNNNYSLTMDGASFILRSTYDVNSGKSMYKPGEIPAHLRPDSDFILNPVDKSNLQGFIKEVVQKDISPVVRAGFTITTLIQHPEYLNSRAEVHNPTEALEYLRSQLSLYNQAHSTQYSIAPTYNGTYIFVNTVKVNQLLNKKGTDFAKHYNSIHGRNSDKAVELQSYMTQNGINFTVKDSKIYVPLGEILNSSILPDKLKTVPLVFSTEDNSPGMLKNNRAGSANKSRANIDSLNYDFYSVIIHELQHVFQDYYSRWDKRWSSGMNLLKFIDLHNEQTYSTFLEIANEYADDNWNDYTSFITGDDGLEQDTQLSRIAYLQQVIYFQDPFELEAYGFTSCTITPIFISYNVKSQTYIVTTSKGNTYYLQAGNGITSHNELKQTLISKGGRDGIPAVPDNDYSYDYTYEIDMFNNFHRQNDSNSPMSMKIDNSKVWKSRGRYVTIADAKNTNLRYYGWKDGIVNDSNMYINEQNKRIVVEMDPKLQNFIVMSNLDLLDPKLAEMIRKGKLTYSHGTDSIMQYIHDADNINDYTFDQIMTYIFPESKVKDFKTLKDMTDDVTAAQNYAVLMTMKDLGIDMETVVDLARKSGKNYAVLSTLYNTLVANEKFVKLINKYQAAYTTWSGKYDISSRYNANDLRMLILRNFDGSARSLLSAYGMERWMAVHNRTSSRSLKQDMIYDTDEEGVSQNVTETAVDEHTLNQQDIFADMFSDKSVDDMIREIAMAEYLKDYQAGKYNNSTMAEMSRAMTNRQTQLTEDLDNGKISETDIQNMYYATVLSELKVSDEGLINDIETGKIKVVNTDVKDNDAMFIRTDKNIKDNIRNTVNRNILPRLNSNDIEAFRKSYPDIPLTEVTNDDGTISYKFDGSALVGKSTAELSIVETAVKNASTELKLKEADNIATLQLYNKVKRQLDKSNERLQRTKSKLDTEKKAKAKTVKVKTNANYNYEFQMASSQEIPDPLQKILNTQMSDATFSKTDVKNISDGDREHAVQSATKILQSIDENLSDLTDQDISDIIEYYAGSSVIAVNLATKEGGDAMNRYYAIETVVLTYLLSQHRKANITLDADQVVKVQTMLENLESLFGTGMAVWKNALQQLNPSKIRNERVMNSIKIEISETSMNELSNAMELEPGEVYSETQLRRLVGDAVVDALKLSFIPTDITVDQMRDELVKYYTKQIEELTKQGTSTKDKEALRQIAEKLGVAKDNLKKVNGSDNAHVYNMYTELSKEIHSEYALTKDQKQQIVSRLMRGIENEVMEGYNKLGKKGKQNLINKLVDWERMMMLSSPGTWIRNAVSNTIVKYTNRLGATLGSKFNKKFMRKSYNKTEAYMIDNMVQNSDAIETDIADTKAKIAKVQNDIKETAKKYESKIHALESEIQSLQNKHEVISKQKTEELEHFKKLKVRLDESDKLTQEYNNLINELESKGIHFETWATGTHNRIRFTDKRYLELRQQYNNAVATASAGNTDIQNIKYRFDQLTNRIKELQKKFPETAQDVTAYSSKLSELEKQLKQLKSITTVKSKSERISLQSKIKNVQSQIDSYEFLLNPANSNLSKEFDKVAEQLDKAEQSLGKYNSEIKSLHNKLARIENKIYNNEQFKKTFNRLLEIESTKSNLGLWFSEWTTEQIDAEIEQLTNGTSKYDAQLNDISSKASKARVELTSLSNEYDSQRIPLNNDLTELSAHLTEVTGKRAETVQGLDILINDLQKRITTLNSMNDAEKEQYNTFAGVDPKKVKDLAEKVERSKYDTLYDYQIGILNEQISEYKKKRKDLMSKKQYRITGTTVNENTKAKVKSLFEDPFYTKVNADGTTKDISFYDSIADGLSRYSDKTYNPLNGNSDAAGDQIVELIVTNMTAKIFNDNRFTNEKYAKKFGEVENFVNKVLFKLLSDNPWIKGRTQDLYSKMITELNLDTDNLYTRASLQVFADAYVYASWEYMHRQNFFTKAEQYIHQNSKIGYLFYKQIAPFASASWNWCMEAINYTPIGMAKGIYQILNFEKQVNKMQEQKMYGSISISSNFTLYEAQKTLGKGILGTLLFSMGALAAGIGIFVIDDEDDKLKIRFSDDVYLDITDVFGNSGFLLGAAMVSGIQDAMANGMSFNKFWSILGQMTTALIDDTIFASIFDSVAYSDTIGDYLIDSIVDSFGKLIPNIWKVFAQTVNSGVETKYEAGVLGSLQYLANQIIPGIAYAMPKKYNIWTGELEQDHPLPQVTTLLNKLLPVDLDIYSRSEAEKIARSVGLSKTYLTGNYEDIGKLDNYNVELLNKMYGQLNAQYLEDFVNNKTKYKVQNSNGTYSTLSYSQMTSEQIKSVINRIMTNDATYAKIYVYTNYMNGKYYASEDTYTILKKLGISKNVYRETTKYSGYA